MNKDKIKGMIYGLCLGDALGAPFEFGGKNRLKNYTGVLDRPIIRVNQFQGKRESAIGQITDDSEMALTLMQSIIKNKIKYNKNDVVISYMAWANSGCCFMGTNTRELLKGVKTINGYNKRYNNKFSDETEKDKWSQSNGCMMRCAPMALLSKNTYLNFAEQDCSLTNPHPICIESNTIYLVILKELLEEKTKEEALNIAMLCAKTDIIKTTIKDGLDRKKRDIETNKGWILHALYCCFYFISSTKETFESSIDEIILLGGDCDTNACIVGALVGAFFGYKKMKTENITKQNIKIMKKCDTSTSTMPRSDEYTTKNLDELIDNVIALL
jgi:ADP-ribosyl-[dinitrogen reductase] hydrolase